MGFAASLRARLTLVLVAVNLVVLGGLALWVAPDDEARALRELRQQKLLETSLRESLRGIEMDDADDLAGVLRSDLWREFEDAIVVDQRRVELEVGDSRPVGAFLHPLGSSHRPPDFPLAAILAAVDRTLASGEPQYVAEGITLPLVTQHTASRARELWGTVYLRPRTAPPPTPLALRVLVFAAVATALGAGMIYLLVGRAVLRPVERLAEAARAFGAGEAPQLPRGGGAEVGALVRSFGEMTERIRGFQRELEQEVAAATERAGSAERRAARQERLAAMGTLAAGLAHEINSPLAGALQGLELIRRDAAGERAERYGALVQEALERIAGLVQRLLRLAPARVEAASAPVQDAVRDLPDFLASRLAGRELRLDLPQEPLVVRAAPGDLFPVVLNLVQNALDALEEAQPSGGGSIEVRARALPSGRVELVVEDDGPGVAEELLPHLFEPFVTTKDVGQGTGLGLALAHATVRQLGGAIEAANRPTGGLRVRIDLPAGEEA